MLVLYENFAADYETSTLRLLERLDLSPPDDFEFEPRMKRQSDGVNDDWVKRYSELRLGTDFDLVPVKVEPKRRLAHFLGPGAGDPGVGRGDQLLDDGRQLAGDEVGEGDVLEHGAEAGADGDPDLLQVLGVAAVLDRLRRGRLHVGDRALDGADDVGDVTSSAGLASQ